MAVLRVLALVCGLASFASAQATSLVDVQVFPIPWKPGTGDPAFDSPTVTFSRLPEGAEAKIYTLRGQLVWTATADRLGIIQWSGRNQAGRTVGPGTYLVLFDYGGRKTTRRVILIR